ncbi:MAG: glutamate permease [Frankiales bacterium]|nr:glutamate permease [Frankiales bacterium]
MTSVLYDAPGPKARRRILIASVVAAALLAGVVVIVVRRLADNDQFASERWSSLLSPGDDRFTRVWELLWEGIRHTLEAAFFAIVCSLILGTLLAVVRLSLGRVARIPVVAVIELFRGIPVVIMIFFVWRILPEWGIDLALVWYLVIGLTLYNSVVISEIVRAGVNSLPRGQTEASLAIGLTRLQTLRLVQLPQAFRVMLPALISQLVVVLKDTSLGFVILFPETLRTANILIQTLKNPIQMYLVVAAMFILVNYGLGKLAEAVERRLSRSLTPSTVAAVPESAPAVAGA